MKSFRKRIIISIEESNDKLKFFNSSNILVAKGYRRVVIGKRGPYVEFDKDQIKWDKFHVPHDQEYRKDSGVVYYEEWRSSDQSNVMLYVQKRTVAYADYKIGKIYISPVDLYSSTGQRVMSE